jgi:hypothetical protein
MNVIVPVSVASSSRVLTLIIAAGDLWWSPILGQETETTTVRSRKWRPGSGDDEHYVYAIAL